MNQPVNSEYPVSAFYFKVSFSGDGGIDADTAFQEVSGISAALDTEDVVEGGENRFVYRLPKAVKFPKLVLKRGIADTTSPLVTWCLDVLQGDFSKKIVTKTIHVFLLNENGEGIRNWTFVNAYPVSWEVDSFNATKNEVAIEKIELSYNYSRREASAA